MVETMFLNFTEINFITCICFFSASGVKCKFQKLLFHPQEFSLYQMPISLMPSDHPDKQVIDVPLHLTFLCFPIEELLKILSCVLLEERVVFLSSNYALLTVIMEVRNSYTSGHVRFCLSYAP